MREYIPPHDFPVEQGHSLIHKAWRDLFLKDFHGRGEKICRWAVLHGGLMIRSCQGQVNFTNTFFSNHLSFFQSWRDIHLKIKQEPKLWKYLHLKLIVKRFQRLCHVQPDLDIFVKVTVQIGDCIKKTRSAHYASEIGDSMQSLPLFVIYWMVTLHWCLDYKALSDLPLVVSQTLGEDTIHLKMSLLVCWGRDEGVISTLGEQERTALRFTL